MLLTSGNKTILWKGLFISICWEKGIYVFGIYNDEDAVLRISDAIAESKEPYYSYDAAYIAAVQEINKLVTA